MLPGSKWHSICAFAEFDTTPPHREVVLARHANMCKFAVRTQLQTVSPGLNCGPDAHFNKHTDKTKGSGPREEDFFNEIIKLNRERKAFAQDSIDWADTAMKCTITC